MLLEYCLHISSSIVRAAACATALVRLSLARAMPCQVQV
jgi:hypothetical protein